MILGTPWPAATEAHHQVEEDSVQQEWQPATHNASLTGRLPKSVLCWERRPSCAHLQLDIKPFFTAASVRLLWPCLRGAPPMRRLLWTVLLPIQQTSCSG